MGDKSGKISAILSSHGIAFPGSNEEMKCPCSGKNNFYIEDGKGWFHCWNQSCSLDCPKGGNYFEFCKIFAKYVLNAPYSSPLEAVRTCENSAGMARKEIQQYVKEAQRKNQQSTSNFSECPIEKRDAAYRGLLKVLKLKEKDFKYLRQRGLSASQIEKIGFRSIPRTREECIIIGRKLQNQGISIKGVPGFCEDYRSGEMRFADLGLNYRINTLQRNSDPDEFVGYLIPSLDLCNRIQLFQTGWDRRLTSRDNKKMKKYSIMSNPKSPKGARAKAACGFVGGFSYDCNSFIPDLQGKTMVPVVEGLLKSYLYYEFTNQKEPVIAMLGVNNIQSLKETLLGLIKFCPNFRGVYDCFDMDYITNQDVKAACAKMESLCNELGLIYERRYWNPKYKGIDDYAGAFYGKIRTI